MIGDKTDDKITKISKTLRKNSSKTFEKEIENIGLNKNAERNISLEKRQKIIDDLRLI